MRTIGNIVECLGPGNWAEPSNLLQPALAKELVATAELICLNPISTRGVTVWLEALKILPSNARGTVALTHFRKAFEGAGLFDEADALTALCGKSSAPGKSRRL